MPGGWVSGVTRLARSHAPPTARLAAASRSWRRKASSSYTSASQMARLAAVHFWPLWPNAERTRSRIAWSRSASAVTMMAFLPLVSAKSGRSGRQPRKRRAVSIAPVRMTPPTRASVTSPRPTSSSGQGRNCKTSRGTPAAQSACASPQPTSTASGAGLRMTALPATSAASTPPAGIESGKFHGGVTTTTPSGSMRHSRTSGAASRSDRA